jgi:hypothetical protein
LSDDGGFSGPSRAYQIVLFALIQIWSLMTFETAMYQLVLLFEKPWSWLLWCSVLIATQIPVLGVFVWWTKQRVDAGPFDWEFRDREVTLSEFGNMMDQYTHDYQYIISRVDYRLLGCAVLVGVVLAASPYVLLPTNELVISLTPAALGLLMMALGIVLSLFLFRLVPSPLCQDFPHYSTRRVRIGVSNLRDLPGTTWVGVRMSIGESHGLYTIRSPRVIARVEDIESVARLQCELSQRGHLKTAEAIIERRGGDEDVLSVLTDDISRFNLTILVRRLLEEYANERGDDEFLEEIIEEVDQAIGSMRQSA